MAKYLHTFQHFRASFIGFHAHIYCLTLIAMFSTFLMLNFILQEKMDCVVLLPWGVPLDELYSALFSRIACEYTQAQKGKVDRDVWLFYCFLFGCGPSCPEELCQAMNALLDLTPPCQGSVSGRLSSHSRPFAWARSFFKRPVFFESFMWGERLVGDSPGLSWL